LNDLTTTYSSDKILLSKYTREDLDERLNAIRESSVEISPWLKVEHPDFGVDDNNAWFTETEQAWKAGRAYRFAVVERDSGNYSGECIVNHINRLHKFANITYWIRTSQTGKGLATSAVRLVARFGFEQLDLHRLEIFVSPRNLASQRVAENAGARREGVLRNRIFHDGPEDALMYSLIPEDLTIQTA
jgi:RimJ/RimL family protein N-acetyltransferase